MFGIESEYAFAVFSSDGTGLGRSRALGMLLEAAKRRFASLPDIHDGRLFLENGSCLYVDCGMHPELATPECTTPWEAVRYVKAGELILDLLAQDVQAKLGSGTNLAIFRSNVDYSVARTTWGCHESYLHTADLGVLFEQVLPHLVSRIIYTGAGGFDNRRRGVRFLISPRVPHLVNAESDMSTESRGICHTKDEPLCGDISGYHRLHVLSGESLCSQRAIFLKVGATALVVALVEAGLRPGDAVRLRNPVAAMRRIAADTKCAAAVSLDAGGYATAIDIQSRYLEAAEANLDRDFMPPWAPEVCREWRAVLERLRGAPDSVCTELDWAIKLSLYSAHLARRGVRWKDLEHPLCTAIANRRARLAEPAESSWVFQLVLELGQLEDCELESESESKHFGPCSEEVRRLQAAAWELFAIDFTFGQIGEGIFESMDHAGVLAHELPDVGDIEAAVSQPPAVGRARVRAECVKRLHGRFGDFHCGWDHIINVAGGQVLDLSDPYFPAGSADCSPTADVLPESLRLFLAGCGRANVRRRVRLR